MLRVNHFVNIRNVESLDMVLNYSRKIEFRLYRELNIELSAILLPRCKDNRKLRHCYEVTSRDGKKCSRSQFSLTIPDYFTGGGLTKRNSGNASATRALLIANASV